MEDTVGYLLALISGLLFGASDSLVRAASAKLKPQQNLIISLLVGTPLIWVTALLLGEPRLSVGGVLAYIVAGLLNFVIGRLLFYYSITYSGATTALILTSPTVAIAALLALIFLGEPLSLRGAAGVLLVTLAVLIASYNPSAKPLHGGKASLGAVAGVAASIVFASTAVLVRAASSIWQADPLYGAAISYTSALPVALAWARGSLKPTEDNKRHLYYMVSAAIIVALAQVTRYYALSTLSVAKATVLIFLYPFFTLFFSSIMRSVTGERPRPIHLIAASLAVIGIFLVEYG